MPLPCLQIIAIVVAIGLVSTLVVAGAVFAMRKFATPSTKPGGAGANAGFKPIPVNGGRGRGSGKAATKPKESISDMLEGSETLEFEEDVEASGSQWGWRPDNGHVSPPLSIHGASRLGPNRGK